MLYLKNKKGISVAAISVAAVVIVMLASVITISLTRNYNDAKKIEFAQELNMISLAVDNYYYENGTYPVSDKQLTILNLSDEIKQNQFLDETESNNSYVLNIIDYNLIGITTLKYGKNTDGNYDVYVLSTTTGKVYYAKGLEIGNKIYYTLNNELSGLLTGNNKLDINSDNGIIFSEKKLDDGSVSVKISIPTNYEVSSVKFENSNLQMDSQNDNYYIYYVETGEVGTINIDYNYDSNSKNTKYTIENEPSIDNNYEIIIKLNTEQPTQGPISAEVSCDNIPDGYSIWYKIDDGKWIKGSKISNITDNCIIYAKLYDSIFGQQKAENRKNVTNIDKIPPKIVDVTGNATEWTNGNVILTVNGAKDDELGLHSTETYSFDGGKTWQTSNSKLYENNTSDIIIKVKDKAGNVYTHEKIDIEYIDKTAPTITSVIGNESDTMELSVTLFINGAKDDQSGLHETETYSFDGGLTWQKENTKTYTENTSNIIIKVKDKVGNIYTHEPINIDIIDKEPPTVVSVTGNPTEWTKNDVTLTVNGATDNGSGLATSPYSFDGGLTWQKENTKTYTENTSNIIIKLKDKLGNIYTHTGINITKIDKTAPSIPTAIDVTPSLNNVTVKASGSTDSGSGVAGYKYRLGENGTWSDLVASGTTYTFSDIKSNTTVKVYAKAVDNLGFESSVLGPVDATTSTVTNKVSISLSTDEWTKGPITATLSYDSIPTGYVIQYKIGIGNWTDGTKTTNISANTIVYGRLYNKTLDDEIAADNKSVTNIDITEPSITSVTGNPTDWTKNDVTLVVNGAKDTASGLHTTETYSFDGGNTWQASNKKVYTANTSNIVIKVKDAVGNTYTHSSIDITKIDKDAPSKPTSIAITPSLNKITVKASGSTDGGSGVAGYKYRLGENGTWSDLVAVDTNYTFADEIKANTNVKVYAKAVDNLGFESSVFGPVDATTSTVTNKVAIALSTDVWTKGPITATLSYDSVPTGYVLQYKIGTGNWTDGTKTTNISANTTVYGRLYNKTLEDEIASNSKSVTNIDNTNPTVIFGTNGNNAASKTASTTVTASDNGSLKTSSLKYLWTIRSSGITVSDFTGNKSGTLTNGQSLSIPSNSSGEYYLYVYAEDEAGNSVIAKSNKFIVGNILPNATITQDIADTTYTKDGVTFTIKPYSPTVLYDNGYVVTTARDWSANSLSWNTPYFTERNYANMTFNIKANVHAIQTADGTKTTGIGLFYKYNNNGTATNGWFRANYKKTQDIISDWVDISAEIKVTSSYASTLCPWIQIDVPWGTAGYKVEYKDIQYELYDPEKIKSVTVNGTAVTINNGVCTYKATENGTYNIVITDIYGNTKTISKTVSNIDKAAPSVPTAIAVTPSLNNVTVKASGSTDVGSGVAGYKYRLGENGTWSDLVASGTSHTFSDIKANTTVKVYAKAVDNLGFESSVFGPVDATTSTVTNKVSISLSTDVWTKGPITATLSYDSIPTGYVIQYKIGTGNWTDGTKTTDISANTTVYGRLYNKTLKDEIASNSKSVTNIDTTAPSITSVSGNPTSWTNGDVTLTVNGASDGGSGLHATETYSFDGGTSWQTSNQKKYTENTSNIVIKVKDKVGNIYTHTAINITKIDKTAPEITSVTGNPTEWTKNDVTLVVNGAADSQSGLHGTETYSFDGGSSWQTSNQKTYTSNASNIIIKVKDAVGNIYTHSAINITKIDKTAPSMPTAIAVTPSLNKITVKASGSTDSGSGLAGYKYRLGENGTWSSLVASGTAHTFNNIKAGTALKVYARAVDKLEWESSEYGPVDATTSIVTNKVAIALSTDAWTKGPITATLSYDSVPTGYVLQYKIGTGNWTTGTTTTDISSNTTIYGRLYNETLNDEIATNSKNITNIDNNPPTNPTGISVITRNQTSIIVKASGSTDVGIGLAGYQYSIDGTNWSSTVASETNYTISSLSVNTTYTVYARAIDKLDNISEGNYSIDTSTLSTYSVSYNSNTTDSVSNMPSSQTKVEGITLTLSSSAPTRTGYTFSGWATSTSGNVEYVAGANYTMDSSVTLYAKWTPITYTVVYNANGGSGTMADSTHTYGVAKTLTANSFTKTGYTFAGWATSSTGEVVYSDEQSVINLSNTDGAKVNLYAVWEAKGPTTIITPEMIKSNPSKYIGKTVSYTGYSENTNTIDWRLFGIDKDGNIMLKANDYIDLTYKKSSYPSGIARGDNKYNIKSTSNRTTLTDYIGTSSNWSEYAVSGKTTARGAMTLPEFVNGYNLVNTEKLDAKYLTAGEKYPDSTSTADADGYVIKKGTGSYSRYVGGITQTYNSMKFYDVSSSKASAMWLASLSSNAASYVMYVHSDGYVNSISYNLSSRGLCPAVSLTACNLVEREDGNLFVDMDTVITPEMIKSNPSKYIGKTVSYTGYSESTNTIDWRLYGLDEDGNIMLKANDYIDLTYKTSSYPTGIAQADNKYRIKSTTDRTTFTNYIGTSSNWSEFAVSGKTTARGAMTLPEFVNGYNLVNREKLEATYLTAGQTYPDSTSKARADGYVIKKGTGNYSANVSDITQTYNGMKFYDVSYNKAYAMWLASLSSYVNVYVMNVLYNGNVSFNGGDITTNGLCPVVSLTSGILVEKADGTLVVGKDTVITPEMITSNPSAYIGKSVTYTGYSENTNTIDWRLYGLDEDGNIMLKANDYIDLTYKTSSYPTGIAQVNNKYKITSTSDRDTLKDYIGTSSNWSEYAVSGKTTARGAMTLPEFVNGYNLVNTKKIEATYLTAGQTYPDSSSTATADGYVIKIGTTSYTTSISYITQTYNGMNFYYGSYNKADGMWLSSLSSNNASHVMGVYFHGAVSFISSGAMGIGLCPAVSLTSVSLVKKGDGTLVVE